MTTDPELLLIVGSTGTAGIGIAAAAALRGWREWLEVRRLEIGGRPVRGSRPGARSGVELADLRARVRRLEAIADGGER
jgi:hypothetical protein